MRTASRPDVQALISGGQERRRRRTVARFGAGVAAAILVGGVVYGVAQLGGVDEAQSGPANEVTPTETEQAEAPLRYYENIAIVEGTTYLVRAGSAENGEIDALLQFDGAGWETGNHPTVSDGAATAGIAVYTPLEVAARSGCVSSTGFRTAEGATSVPGVVAQLRGLPKSTVVQAATPIREFGYEGVHLRVRIADDCAEDAYLVAETPAGSHGISYSNAESGFNGDVLVDFQVMDVDGTPVVVERFWQAGASRALIAQTEKTLESITLRMGD